MKRKQRKLQRRNNRRRKRNNDGVGRDVSKFEMRSNKRSKNAVFGRKLQQQKRNVQETLLVEYQSQHSANKFVDRRLGQNRDDLDDEDKMLLRLQRQREREFRKNRFKLSDGPGEDLTHYGQKLGADDFDLKAEGLLSDDEIDDDLNAEIVEQMNFGGGEDGKNKAKTRREILREIIQKSKLRKIERAKEKEEREQERLELDAELDDITDLLDFGNKEKQKKMTMNQQDESYDRVTRELALAHRAQATDRMKTPQEIAKAEQERLRLLEEDRQKRMRAENEEDTFRGGDDLEENFVIDPEFMAQGDDGEEEEEEKEEDEEEDEEDKQELERKAAAALANNDLPFVFETCPDSLKSLRKLMFKWGAYPQNERDMTRCERAGVLLDRVRVSHSALVKESNAPTLALFLESCICLLVAHCERDDFFSASFVTAMTRTIWDTAKEIPDQTANLFRERLQNAQKDCVMNRVMPSMSSLIDLSLVSVLYSTTDYRHAIATPASLLIGQYLSQGEIIDGLDVLRALHLVEMSVRFTKDSGRFVPESLAFLSTMISRVAMYVIENEDEQGNDAEKIRAALLVTPRCCPAASTLLVRIEEVSNSKSTLELLCREFQLNKNRNGTHLLPSQGIFSVLRLIRVLAKTHQEKVYFRSSFSSIMTALRKIAKSKSIPNLLKLDVTDTLNLLSRIANESESSRDPLQMKILRPAAIKEMIPRFEEDFDPSRDMDTDRARAAMKQLKRKVRREKKGVLRELRRDNAFLSRQHEADIQARDERLEERQNDVMRFLQQQQAEFKQMAKQGLHGGGSGGGGLKAKKRQFG
eukprot:g4131.t1